MVVTIDNPPANALTPALRGQLLLALVEARSRGARAVVLTGAGHNFSAASTIDSPGGHPSLAEICRAVETLELPVAVVMQGLTVGPGAELALAAHLRLADAGARMVFPEVGLGLVPEAGTTQRLPRLVGAADALELLLKGRPVGAAEALAMGLVDRLHEGPDAVGAAAALALVQPGPRPVSARYDGLRDPAAFNAAVAAARAERRAAVLPAADRKSDG